LIKLVVGVEDLDDFYRRSRKEIIDYDGQPAVPCWTRFMPKRADDVMRQGGSIYRVMNKRIQCRLRILGFEMVDVPGRGRMCMIMQDPDIIETVALPHRPFQGWRYLDPAKAPADKGLYKASNESPIPPDLARELKDAGII